MKYVILGAILLFLAVIGGVYLNIRLNTGAGVIVEAKVLATREDKPGQLLFKGLYLSIINITEAYPSHHPIWSTRSDCPLAIGQVVDVRVATAFFNQPQSANTTLYRPQGIGYDPWNGC